MLSEYELTINEYKEVYVKLRAKEKVAAEENVLTEGKVKAKEKVGTEEALDICLIFPIIIFQHRSTLINKNKYIHIALESASNHSQSSESSSFSIYDGLITPSYY